MSAKSFGLPLGIAVAIMLGSSAVGGLVMLIPSSKPSSQASVTTPSAVQAAQAGAAAAVAATPSQPWISALTSEDLNSLQVGVTVEAETVEVSASSNNFCGAAPSAPSDTTTAEPVPSDMEFFCQVDLAGLPSGLLVGLPVKGVLQLFRSTTDRTKGFARLLPEVSGTESGVAVASIDRVDLRVLRGVFTLDPALGSISQAHPELNVSSVDPAVQGLHESLDSLGYPVRMFGMGGTGIDVEQTGEGFERLFEFSPDDQEITGFYLPREDMAIGRFDRIRVNYN
jgi:hypothetical protein